MDLIQTGKITNTHGIRGEIRVQSWAKSPEELTQLQTLYIDEKPYPVVGARVHKNMVLIKLKGIDSIDEAELLKNKILYAEKTDFHLNEGEYFIEDLIGIEVFDIDTHISYGKICEVLQTGANDVYDILDCDGTHRLIPAIRDCVIETDIKNQKMLIRPLKGLFD